jgi:hypothetical protein
VVSVGYVPKEFILSIEKNDFLRLDLTTYLPFYAKWNKID